MVKKSKHPGKASAGNQRAANSNVANLASVLKQLLELGFIELPKISQQWKRRINAALDGDLYPLQAGFQDFHSQLDPLLALKAKHPMAERWQQSEFKYVYQVAQVLFFWLDISTQLAKVS